MASEISISATLSFVKGALNNAFTFALKQVNMAGSAYVRGTMTAVITTGTAVPLGGVATAVGGWFLVYNNDPTNFVSIATTSAGTKTVRILPGEFAMGRFETAAPFIIADTASVVCEYLLIAA